MKLGSMLVLITTALAGSQAVSQESPQSACQNALDLYAEKDVAGALEEAKWCVTLLEQEQQQKVKAAFPDKVLGYTGNDVEYQQALGFSSIQRIYQKDAKKVTVTLSGGNGMNQAISAFAAIAEVGGGGKKMRIQKRTATMMSSGNQTRVMVNLKLGGMLMFEANQVSPTELTEFANAFPVANLDEARD